MAVDARIDVPFLPQEQLTHSILAAIQMANEQHFEQQKINIQKQAQQSKAALEAAQTGGTQAETELKKQQASANLPAVQAAGEQARTNLTNIQAQAETEQNPLKKTLLQSQARQLNAEASLNEARAKFYENPNPSDFNKSVDDAIPPDKYPELNKRTHASVDAAQRLAILDPEGPTRALASGISEINAIERETDPSVIAARVKQSVDTQRALYGGGAVSGVAPHLVQAATADATKAGTDYAQALSVSQRLSAMMDAAKKGNVVSYQLIPQEGALQVTTSQGVHRINMAEIQNYGGGSIFQRMEGHIGKELTGKSIPDSVLNDMSEMQKIQSEGARSKYENTLKTINKNYGSTFQPLDFAQPTASAAPAGPPAGATMKVPGSDGKLHWSDGKQDLGIVQ